MNNTLKIVIPMAGWGTRMRPHTWSKPKPLVSVGGKPSFDHLMDMFDTLPKSMPAEFIFIVSPYLGELQIPAYMAEHYPHVKAHYVVQHEMKGQSHAIYLAREYLSGPMIMCFSDTLMETDFSFLAEEQADGVAWVKPVEDPRRFGVAELDTQGWVTRFIEKPQSLDNNLVVVGCYYFKDSQQILHAIETQMQRNMLLKNEYFLTDAISIMIELGAKVRTNRVQTWLDTGTIDATLDTNRYLLTHGRENSAAHVGPDVTITRPVFIHPSAQISNSHIGPHVSIGANCTISDCTISDSIIEPETHIDSAAITRSLIGRQAHVRGGGADVDPMVLNIGDNAHIRM